ncbi:hypothetical protein B296_00053633, partial [Ensete ventricosum]
MKTVDTKVCNFESYRPVQAVRTSPPTDPPSERYHGFCPVPSDIGLYRAEIIKISIVTARYRSVTIDFDRRRPLPSGISLAAAGCSEGRRRKRKKKRENIRQCRPLIARQQFDCRKHLQPDNPETALRMRTSRGDDFFVATFSSSPSPRLRRREKEGSVNDFSSLAREEALMTSPPREEKKTSRHR